MPWHVPFCVGGTWGEAFLCGGWLFHLVSDGCLSSGRPFFIRNVSPTAYVPSSFSFFASGGVLSFNSERKYPKNASRNQWFLHFLPDVQELLLKSRRSEELVCFYSCCRFIGRLKGLTTLLSENSSPQSHCHSEETAEAPPVADTARRFQESVLIFTPQRGWKPADTTVKAFCCCWQKVCRRRQVFYPKPGY